MNLEEFYRGMNILTDVFGDKAYPRARVDVIWRTLQHSPINVWLDAINGLIGDCERPPGLTKIKDTLYASKKKMNLGDDDFWTPIRRQMEALQKVKNACNHCFGYGIISAHRLDDAQHYQYSFGCVCTAGNLAMQLPENKDKMRQWSISMRGEWKPEHEGMISVNDISGEGMVSEASPSEIIRLTNSGLKDLSLGIGSKAPQRRAAIEDRWDLKD